MNPTGIGLSNRPTEQPEAAPQPAATGLRGWLANNRRVIVLAAAGLVVVVGGGVAVLTLSGGSEPQSTDPSGRPAAAGGGATATPTATGPTKRAGAATPSGTRNPFAARVTPSGSATTTGSGTASGTASPAATATITDPAVYLALFSVAADGTAKFSVNGTTYSQNPGDTFGEGKALTYHKSVQVSGASCASVSYVDQTYTVCPGEMHQVD
jgi:hypothetical protein